MNIGPKSACKAHYWLASRHPAILRITVNNGRFQITVVYQWLPWACALEAQCRSLPVYSSTSLRILDVRPARGNAAELSNIDLAPNVWCALGAVSRWPFLRGKTKVTIEHEGGISWSFSQRFWNLWPKPDSAPKFQNSTPKITGPRNPLCPNHQSFD